MIKLSEHIKKLKNIKKEHGSYRLFILKRIADNLMTNMTNLWINHQLFGVFKSRESDDINPHLKESSVIEKLETKIAYATIAGLATIDRFNIYNASPEQKLFLWSMLIMRFIVIYAWFRNVISKQFTAFLYATLKDSYNKVTDNRLPLPDGFTNEGEILPNVLKRLKELEDLVNTQAGIIQELQAQRIQWKE